jgi:hypothetical protein
MIRVLDNVLPAYEFKELHDEIMQQSFPWTYGRKSSDEAVVTNPFLYGFVRIVVQDGTQVYDPHGIIQRNARLALGYAGEKLEEFIRIRCILNTAADKNYDFGAHTDLHNPCKVALLYLNDSDGDTVIYNERYQPVLSTLGGNVEIEPEIVPVLTIRETVTPKANRMVIFDGNLYHSGSTPTKVPRRVAININYTTEGGIIPIHTPNQTLISS